MIYRWREGSRYPVPAQAAGIILEAVRADTGSLTPASVVDAARDETSDLHPCFEWDDSTAAERYRERQARGLIASLIEVHVEPETRREVPVLAFASVRPPELGHRSYERTQVIMGDSELRQQAIGEALALLNGVRKRFAHLDELGPIFGAIDRAAKARQAKPRKAPRKAVAVAHP